MTYIIIHVTQNNFPCNFLEQQFTKLCYHYWENWLYLLAPHETFRIFLILLLIMISFADMDLICIGIMIGRETHELDVSFGKDDSHTFCIACSNGSMRGDMATTAK